MKVDTVNVIEYADDSVLGVHSFTDNEKGNKEAEAIFRQVAKENGMEDVDAESFVEDGYFEQGSYQVFITHSS